jgi:hypothetical protein
MQAWASEWAIYREGCWRRDDPISQNRAGLSSPLWAPSYFTGSGEADRSRGRGGDRPRCPTELRARSLQEHVPAEQAASRAGEKRKAEEREAEERREDDAGRAR